MLFDEHNLHPLLQTCRLNGALLGFVVCVVHMAYCVRLSGGGVTEVAASELIAPSKTAKITVQVNYWYAPPCCAPPSPAVLGPILT